VWRRVGKQFGGKRTQGGGRLSIGIGNKRRGTFRFRSQSSISQDEKGGAVGYREHQYSSEEVKCLLKQSIGRLMASDSMQKGNWPKKTGRKGHWRHWRRSRGGAELLRDLPVVGRGKEKDSRKKAEPIKRGEYLGTNFSPFA